MMRNNCATCNACDPTERGLMNRRQALRSGLLAALGTAVGTGVVRAASTIYPTPSETQGPFWEDERLNRSDIRTDPKTGVYQKGYRLDLTLRAYKLARGAATPLTGAWIDLWQANAYGSYSDEPAGMGNANTQGQYWLRGYQVANKAGITRFTTIFPGWYSGRTPHIHVRVRTFSGKTTTLNFTTQIFFQQSLINTIYAKAPYTVTQHGTTNATDNVYNAVTASSGSTKADPDGEHTTARITNGNTGASGTFTMYVA